MDRRWMFFGVGRVAKVAAELAVEGGRNEEEVVVGG